MIQTKALVKRTAVLVAALTLSVICDFTFGQEGNCTIVCPPDTIVFCDPGTCSATLVLPAPEFTGDCDESTLSWETSLGGSGVGLLEEIIVPIGTVTITYWIDDNSGDPDSCTFQVMAIDSIPPSITCPPDTILSTTPDSCWKYVDPGYPLVVDNCMIDTIWNSYMGGTSAAGYYPHGTTTVWWYVLDSAGNVDSCSMTVSVIDVTPPTIICPPDTIVPATLDECSAYIELPVPFVFESCGLDSVWNDYTSTASSSGVFPVGLTSVKWYAVDEAGNIDSCSHKVTVVDTEPPELDCPQDIAQSVDSGMMEAFVHVPLPDVFDNCTIDSIFNNYTGTTNASGVYALGRTVVDWIVYDVYGNSSSCSMNITVLDNLGVRPHENRPQQLKIAPNPGKGKFLLHFNLQEETDVTVWIIDQLGHEVKKIVPAALNQGEQEIKMDLHDLHPGIYFVKISAGKQFATARLILTDL